MTTKEQERKALEQIKKIVEGLGEDSYVGIAFEGCFRDAEENIENDWACSRYDAWQMAEQKNEELRAQMEELKNERDALKMLNSKNNAELAKRTEEANEDAQEWKSRYEKVVERMNEYHDESIKHWNMFREQEDKVAELEQKIINLKAKLYDMIVAE